METARDTARTFMALDRAPCTRDTGARTRPGLCSEADFSLVVSSGANFWKKWDLNSGTKGARTLWRGVSDVLFRPQLDEFRSRGGTELGFRYRRRLWRRMQAFAS